MDILGTTRQKNESNRQLLILLSVVPIIEPRTNQWQIRLVIWTGDNRYQ